MPTTAAITRGESAAVPLESASIWLLYAALLWPALAGGAHAGWLLVAAQLLGVLSALAWVSGMVVAGRLEWRRAALDRPVGLLIVLIATQLVLGPGPLLRWALASPESAAFLPARFLFVGTVSPGDTTRALLLFLTYVGVYAVVVNVVRHRADVERLVRTLLVTGGVVAFASLVDFLAREDWVFRWRAERLSGRLTGPFANPDHCATWLLMLVCLGMGYLAARRGQARSESGRLADIVRSPRDREAALRRHLPAFGVGLMTLAMVLTLSRGALVSLAVTGALGLLAAARLGRLRRSLALACALGAMILGYGLWIGLGPLLHRVGSADALGRVLQWQATLPMLAVFPTFGVGLGAYKEAFFHFQPSTLGAGHMYFPYAHSDLLQLLIETGPLGAALALWAAGRVARDLLGAHLLGRGRCPVGRDTGARRAGPARSAGARNGSGDGSPAAARLDAVQSLRPRAARLGPRAAVGGSRRWRRRSPSSRPPVHATRRRASAGEPLPLSLAGRVESHERSLGPGCRSRGRTPGGRARSRPLARSRGQTGSTRARGGAMGGPRPGAPRDADSSRRPAREPRLPARGGCPLRARPPECRDGRGDGDPLGLGAVAPGHTPARARPRADGCRARPLARPSRALAHPGPRPRRPRPAGSARGLQRRAAERPGASERGRAARVRRRDSGPPRHRLLPAGPRLQALDGTLPSRAGAAPQRRGAMAGRARGMGPRAGRRSSRRRGPLRARAGARGHGRARARARRLWPGRGPRRARGHLPRQAGRAPLGGRAVRAGPGRMAAAPGAGGPQRPHAGGPAARPCPDR